MTASLIDRAPRRASRPTPVPSSGSSRPGWLVRVLSEMPAPEDGNHLYLGVHVRGRVTVVRKGAETLLEPDDLVFCDPARRQLLQFGEDCRMIFFRVPRCYLGATEAELNRVLGVPVRGGEGIGALVSDFLSALAATAQAHRLTIGDRRARTAVHLLSVLVMELLETDPEGETADATAPANGSSSGVGHEMLARIRSFIEEHLMDPDLSPESIARAHHISVRYLHKLFQNDGTTVSQWVRQRRLESCRIELGRSNRRFTMAAVAHRWGFSSPSHFSRTFRGAYGMTPSEWHALATSALAPPATGADADADGDGPPASDA